MPAQLVSIAHLPSWRREMAGNELSFWKGVLAIVLWPYLLGADLAAFDGAMPPAQPSE